MDISENKTLKIKTESPQEGIGIKTQIPYMKEGVSTMTAITIYQNKQNTNKYIEVHNDGYYHNAVRQYMEWVDGVKNPTGDGFLHRIGKQCLNMLLADYTLLQVAK